MLSGATLSAAATVGTAVFRMVVSSASMKKATATSHGSSRLTDSSGEGRGGIGGSIVRRRDTPGSARFDGSHPRLEAELGHLHQDVVVVRKADGIPVRHRRHLTSNRTERGGQLPSARML